MGTTDKTVAQSLIVTPPRAYGLAGPFGQVIVFAVTTTAIVVDLTKLTFGLEFNASRADSISGNGAPVRGPQGAVGSHIHVFADQCDLGVITGATLASVSGGNAPNLSTIGALDSNGVYLGTNGTCYRIPATVTNDEPRWRLQIGQDNFLGIVASNNVGICRLYVSSEAGSAS